MSLKDIGVTPPKGFRDILPQETLLRDRLLHTIIETYRAYGFERIETPAVEDIRRLSHSEGGENLGLMFKILKRGEKLDLARVARPEDLVDLALRYDLTVPLSRYYANNRAMLPPVFKAIQIGPVWRAERPQHGRFRQFTQCDIDIIGGRAPADEVQLISVTLDALQKIGIQDGTVRINDRRVLSALVSSAGIPEEAIGRALVTLDKMDKIGFSGVHETLLADGFNESAVNRFIGVAQAIEGVPPERRLAEARTHISAVTGGHVFDEMASIVEHVTPMLANGSKVQFDPFLVRGMGYYTGAVFEVVIPGFSGSIAGGGRYDKLIGKLSGNEATACGFSIGFERLVSILMERSHSEGARERKVAIFYDPSSDSLSEVLAEIRSLQKLGAFGSMFVAPRNMKAALERLKQSGFTQFARFKKSALECKDIA